ncbi:trifunctional serine/threonine-protein kinase/ATP-binding protein/sensor histidine kinase [Lusitaniella coriacea]|uniref:trifunctional serine/threonine-protein kinase/ATP-binding protein/sensor histidine kinase n=1 Tax=Lusitaniella coriacea TaxID=1983105 RepID=UPI003CF42D1E
MMTSTLVTLPNYQLTEQIYEGTRTLVYRGRNLEDEQPVVIKLMRSDYPSFRELVQFRNQYAITKNLEIEGIVKSIALERYENRYALIMADTGGISLAEYKQQSSLSLQQFLNIAIQIAEILQQLHNNSIIHKDIKPANILIHPETNHIKLIDFSISSLLPKETQTLQTPNILEGTLTYLSPEQTGRMNRGIDYRSDFYSLGVTFYELLTGALPFNQEDPLELIHAHIAEPPKPIGDIYPQPLSDIVMKLMAKNAEERYQSALGLKYDLENCRTAYRETGTIESFKLGERDICDRFLIPEKLYGRENEVKTLLKAFNRIATGTSEMMLVAGFSGIGKTAVVHEVHKPIVKNRGYFIKGKFDQFNRNIPFSAFVQAFRSLMGQILSESDAQLQGWKTHILEAVGNNGQVLIDVIPELETVIGVQSPVPELSGNTAQTRFNLLFEKFIAVFTTKEHPLVIFLDDLQWADSASLNLMKVLMGDNETGYLLLLGAYRDNEVFPAHPLMLTLAELAKQEATISTITLTPLSLHYINQLVAETLSCNAKKAQPLTELVYQKTQGNPFFTTQFLKGLYEDKLITFNPNVGYWECDLVKVRDAALTSDVVEFMASRLQKLPAATQEVLKLAACIGNQFDLETLAIVRESSSEEVASELWNALQEGMISPISEAYKFFQGEIDLAEADRVAVNYRFLHDRVQQAAYSLIPEEQKQITHLEIGQLLLKNTPETELKSHIFTIVNHWNIALELVSDEVEKWQLVRLNQIAGRKAKSAIAYPAAIAYLSMGMKLLPPDAWQTHYELTLAYHNAIAEATFLNGDFGAMQQWIDIVLQQSRNILDKIEVYTIQIYAEIAQKKPLEGIKTGLQALSRLGIQLPAEPTGEEIQQALTETTALLPSAGIVSLRNLPSMSDPETLAAMRISSSLAPAAYMTGSKVFLLNALAEIRLSIQYGNAPTSAAAYAHYGIVLCGIVNDIESGYQFGKLALSLAEQSDSKALRAKIALIAGALILPWKTHPKDTLTLLQNGYQNGLESGSLAPAAFCRYYDAQSSYIIGQELSELETKLAIYSQQLRQIKQEAHLDWNEILRQVILNLQGTSNNPCYLVGDAVNEEQLMVQYQATQNSLGLYNLYLHKLILCYWFEKNADLLSHAGSAAQYISGVTAQVVVPLLYFYDALARLRVWDELSTTEREQALEQVNADREKLNKWASHAPMNYQHKVDLVAAEYSRVLDKKLEAMDLYDRAIAGAKANKYIQEEALANELAAKFYRTWGKEKIARTYLIEAYYCYAQWGAKAKINDLEQRYPKLLQPILQRDGFADLPVRLPSSGLSLSTVTGHSQTATIANISDLLDFSSLLKASQTLSGEIELSPLLSTLMKIILENAGATKGALLLIGEQGLTVEAIATRTDTEKELKLDSVHQSIPLEDYQDLPSALINTVRRTAETALLDAKTAQEQFTADNYLRRFSPQSLLCFPLLERGNLIGILYLENTFTADAFTRDRVKLLDALCAQAAISLTNARLYQKAQQALQGLQAAQLQLVQNEKMATLGNLVAGVAHEINNPASFIGGNVSAAQEYLQDLLDAIELYQQKYPSPDPELTEELEDLDLEFIAEDFPQLIASMQTGCDRIQNISTSLRTFSRTDTDKKTGFNLHEGIDSTLLILKYRLKANKNRPAIEIVRNYGNLREVKCYAGQINQVFMNLIANAIDALDESNEGRHFEEIEANPNRITIQTEASEERAIVRIGDNGKGMPDEMRQCIFEQGFTTKGVGKGTGLGLAIARQIIVEKHGGSLKVQSELGQGTQFCIQIPISDVEFGV